MALPQPSGVRGNFPLDHALALCYTIVNKKNAVGEEIMPINIGRRFGLMLVVAALVALPLHAAWPQEQPVRLGIALPLSGQYADYVKHYMAAGTELAVKEANASGQKVELFEEDSHFDGAGAVAALTKLADVNKILAVFTAFTPVALPMLPVAEEKHIIVAAASAEHPDLTKSHWGLRMTPTADKQGLVLARLARKLNLNTAAVLAEDNEAIRITIRVFEAEFQKLGGKMVGEETFRIGDTDMRPQLTKLRAARPDVLYIMVSSGRPIALALKQLAEVDFHPKQIFSDHLIEDREVQAIGREMAEGVIYTSLDIAPDYVARFRAAFGYDPDANAGKHYDATMLVLNAVKRVGSTDPVKVRDAVYNYGEYKGVVGTFRFTGTGEPEILPILKVVKDGKYVDYKE